MSSNDPTRDVSPPPVEGIISRLSPYSVEQTLERLETTIGSLNLTIFAHINHSGEAQQVGLNMQEAHVLIFGNPKAGTPLMIASPLLALDLPLKLLVWQGDDGRVWISYTSTDFLAARYSIPHELTGNIAGIKKVVERVVSRL
jgi:uncharacterized protein (DUF302 family)